MEEMRVLGITITSDMNWRLKNAGAKQDDLVDIYCKQVRSLLKFEVPAWHGGITNGEHIDIERIQKSACHIILGATTPPTRMP